MFLSCEPRHAYTVEYSYTGSPHCYKNEEGREATLEKNKEKG